MNKQQLVEFENKVESMYKNGQIRGPVHLRDGNEDQLISIFANVKKNDWVFSTWANHLHALLKGIPEGDILDRILKKDSMAMSFPKHKFFTSAIVGGILPIATGVAYSIKEAKNGQRVWCFVGDMSVRTGVAHESIMYSIGHRLPITFVVEDNGKSVGTPTESVYPVPLSELINKYLRIIRGNDNVNIIHYKYESRFPHSGTGTFVSF